LPGVASVDFLKLGAGAKELGMGNAVISIAGHYACMIPDAITALRKKEVSLMHSYYFREFPCDCAAFIIPCRHGVFGNAFQYFSSGTHERENNENGDLSSVFLIAFR